MKAVVLSGIPVGHASMTALAVLLASELARAGHDVVETLSLAELPLAYCQGEFDCWVKSPGVCRTEDAEMRIAAAVHDADTLVLLGPVAFGGHGHVQKRALDRLICLLEPFFEKRAQLTHHGARYAKSQRWFAVGWAERTSEAMARTFAELVDANALNFLAPGCGSVVVDDAHDVEWPWAIRQMLAHPRTPGEGLPPREELRKALFTAAAPEIGDELLVPVRGAAILVGSPKRKGTSASETMARALVKRFDAASIATELHFATEFVHDDARSRGVASEIASRDLFLLVSPLYIDAYPSLTTHALELVADARAREPVARRARFAVLVNCGFPEAEHNRTALRIARHFAHRADYEFAGGLSLGAGGLITPQHPLDVPHGPEAHVVRALDRAAQALARGEALPAEAIEEMAAGPMPDGLYRRMGNLGFRWQAHQNHLPQRALHARPLDEPAEPGEDSEPITTR